MVKQSDQCPGLGKEPVSYQWSKGLQGWVSPWELGLGHIHLLSPEEVAAGTAKVPATSWDQNYTDISDNMILLD
jgi:hypothetical protein